MSVTKILLEWYKLNQRARPWRESRDPYLIWISEVILQQTRVGQGLKYYLRFIERFPAIEDLARSEEKEVLKAWQGLGYYSRARNLHAAAKDIFFNQNGVFPKTYDEMVRLKGIGPYTAAAIASIAFDQPYPVVDGNVLRFLSRYFGIKVPVNKFQGKKMIHNKAFSLIDQNQPGTFNQAIMEFGALQCRPGRPDCKSCPLKTSCYANINDEVDLLPVTSKAKRQRIRHFYYLVITGKDEKGARQICLKKREGKDVWKNLYDFPLIETERKIPEKTLFYSSEWKKLIHGRTLVLTGKSRIYKHILTHQVIYSRFFIYRQTGVLYSNPPCIAVSLDEIDNYPVPRLVEQFLHDAKVGF